MGDSMDEELERGGVALAHAPGPHAFAGGRPTSIGYQHPQQGGGGPNLAPPARGLAGVASQHHPLRLQHQHQLPGEGQGPGQGQGQGWARKRGRGDEADISFVQVAGTGTAAAHAVRSESPDSEMSSSSGSGGSEGSINRGIKRMRLGQEPFDLQQQQQRQQQQRQQQQQQQHQHQQQLQQHTHHQGQHPLSAFDRFPSAPPQTAGAQHNPTTLHHPRPITLGRALPDNRHTQAPASSSNSNNAYPSRGPRSGSRGLLQLASAAGGNPAGQQHQHQQHQHQHQQRSSSFDCVAFPPSAPQPPAQARYVRGIRVEANAPSDVDYSNVNHALRQLHMERRMMAAARAAGAVAGGGWAGGGPSR